MICSEEMTRVSPETRNPWIRVRYPSGRRAKLYVFTAPGNGLKGLKPHRDEAAAKASLTSAA